MCGIIGYNGNLNINEILINGLKQLEYRGYDSAGIASFDQNNNLIIEKSTGKISNLEKKINSKNLNLKKLGIAHTRWATHGIPNENNSHPHYSKNITLVHNGIIENYIELKNILINNGYIFYSDTDTEVACKYIDYIYSKEKNKIKCLIKACNDFKGSYAFAILFKNDDNIYVTRKNSPLVIGTSDNGNFISSDVSAFLNYTNKYILLNHNEYGIINKEFVTIVDENLNEIKKEIKTANWSINEFQKKGYKHFMLKEINEQPEVIKDILNRYFFKENLLPKIDFKKFKKIHIIACGSAYHAGLIGKYFIEKYGNIECIVNIASEYRYSKQFIDKNTLAIIISQSGETADSIAALQKAKENKATILSIVNVVGSTIARESDYCIYTYAGPEIAVATTKGYTSQIAVLLSLAFEINSNYCNDNININFKEIKEILNANTFFETSNNVIKNYESDYINIAEMLYKHNDIFFIGRGLDNEICKEAALKLKEISYIHCESYPAGELKHGTISLIEKGTPVIAITSNESLSSKTISNIKETKSRGATIIYITTKNIDIDGDFYDKKIVLPHINEFLDIFNIAYTVQLIAYNTAKLKKCDIDKPKNLAKSVTVE